MLLSGFFGLFARQRSTGFIGTVTLLFFFSNLYVQRDPRRFGSGLRAFCFLDRPFLGIAPRFCLHIETRSKLRFTFRARARFGLRLLAC